VGFSPGGIRYSQIAGFEVPAAEAGTVKLTADGVIVACSCAANLNELHVAQKWS
jgi:hypothetical protein